MLTLLALHSAPALACGGFFCNNDRPVDQSGEVIAFSIDEEADKVTMHVQVDYTGPSESFAWIIPTPGVPDIARSHPELFFHLDIVSRPQFRIDTVNDGCIGQTFTNSDTDTDADSDSDSDSDTDSDSDDAGVVVLASSSVAAYETVTLSATNETVLVQWLQDNDYDIPSEMAEVLAPYIAGGMNFVAIKLEKDADTGNLPPLRMTYDGTTPVVPLTLTAVAATPDMPMTVYMMGDARAVPTNYLHVRLNPLAIDYWTAGSNLDLVIARAADEAGGKAFATLAAIEDVHFLSEVYRPSMFRLELLESESDAAQFVMTLSAAGFFGTEEVLEVLREFFPVPSDFSSTESAFYNSPSQYQDLYDAFVFDPAVVVEALVAAEVQPRIDAQEFLDSNRWLTRLRSSVSPEEMTLDPQFGINPDLDAVSPLQPLTNRRICIPGAETQVTDAIQRLEYPEGQTITIPSVSELQAIGLTPFEYVRRYVISSALLIEQMNVSGPPEVLIDNRPDGGIPLASGDGTPSGAFTREQEAGCGCSSTGTPAALLALVSLLGLVIRRRV